MKGLIRLPLLAIGLAAAPPTALAHGDHADAHPSHLLAHAAEAMTAIAPSGHAAGLAALAALLFTAGLALRRLAGRAQRPALQSAGTLTSIATWRCSRSRSPERAHAPPFVS